MAKEVSAQVKGRQTKLEKKTHSELVAIVLKKDKCERNLNNQIVNLKAENNRLSSRISAFDKDMEGTMRSLENYKKKYSEKCDMINALNKTVSVKGNETLVYKDKYEGATKTVVEKETVINSYKKVLWIVSIYAVLATLCWVLG